MEAESPPTFTCDGCGACCRGRSGTVTVMETDFQRWLEAGREDLMRSVVPGHFGHQGLAVNEEGDCVHLDANRRCTIHVIRPDTCRDYAVGCEQCLVERRLWGIDKRPAEAM